LEIGKIVLIIAAVALPLACIAFAGQPNEILITKADDGKEITVAKGAIIEVKLEQSAGTGYLWEIVDPDTTHLKVLQTANIPLAQGKISGGPLLRTWKIKAVESGQTNLKVFLYRSWEGVDKAADKLQVKILIE
jgi:predicted secreted protein